MVSNTVPTRPRVLLAFGAAFSPWLAPTYAPLHEQFDVLALTSNVSVPLGAAQQTQTSQRLLRCLPRPLGLVSEQVLYRLWPDYDRIRGLRKYLVASDIVHTVETSSGVSLQTARLKRYHDFRHVVTVWENIARRQCWHPRVTTVQSRVIASADHFIAISERTRTSLMLEGVEPDRITVVGAGMSVPPSAERLPPQNFAFRFLFVGKKQRSKGVEDLLQAFWLTRRDPELSQWKLSLVFVGVEPSKGPYASLIRKYGLEESITEIPFLAHDRVKEHYRLAHALVVPSRITTLWQEQWGMVFMEAMSQGLPIVTTHSGSISEVAGDAALYAQPNDHHSLYLCLKKIVLDSQGWRSLSLAGLRASADRFNVRDVAEKIADVYNRVLVAESKRSPV